MKRLSLELLIQENKITYIQEQIDYECSYFLNELLDHKTKYLSASATVSTLSREQKTTPMIVNELVYIYDARVNLCFAVYSSYYRAAITRVPCGILGIKHVKLIIINKKEKE